MQSILCICVLWEILVRYLEVRAGLQAYLLPGVFYDLVNMAASEEGSSGRRYYICSEIYRFYIGEIPGS